MRSISEANVLDFYLEQIDKDTIEFLKRKDKLKDIIKDQINALKNERNMHLKIQNAKNLWKSLFEAAMSFIDPDKAGYDRLFKYFDQYVEFEELIFASDSFYRDHTLHCLWVYFLGEYVSRNKEFFPTVGDVLQMYNDHDHWRSELKKLNDDGLLNESLKINEDALKYIAMFDSIRCVTALTHDLGYPLKKIYRINKCIKDILPYYDIDNYDEFNFDYTGTQQNFINSFIEFLSWNFNLSTSKEYENYELEDKYIILNDNMEPVEVRWDKLENVSPDELLKLKKTFILEPVILHNTALKFRYSNDFQKYEHGIMSAFLLMKNIEAFKKMNICYYDNLNIPPYFNNIYEINTKMRILRSITDHTSTGYQIRKIDPGSAFLTFIDELEEFSRISRANQNRQYVYEFCKTDIYMDDGWFNVDFIFTNTEIDNLDPEKAFKGRCKKFLTLFDIPELDPSLKIRLRCIGKLSYDDNTYTLEIARKHANIMINGIEQNIPKYLKTNQFYTKEEYINM